MTRRKRIGSGTTGVGGLTFVGSAIQAATSGANITLDAAGTGDVVIESALNVSNSTNATSSSPLSGAVQVPGGAGVVQNLWIGGTLNLGGGSGINNTAIGATTPAAATFTSLTASGLTLLTTAADSTATKTSASGTVTHDFTESNVWIHSSIAGNFTVNLTNVPTTVNRTLSITLHLVQGSTAYYASAFQIDGSAQTIRWVGGATPSPQANKFEIQTFTLIRTSGGSWVVTGQLASYGSPPDGSTQALAAPNALFIKTHYPSSTSGNYWIKPPGQAAYQIYCDMTNNGGGWMLVGRGREGGGQSGNNNWFQDAGIGSYSSALQSGNITVSAGNYNPTYMPAAWVRAATGDGTWYDIELIVNRPQIGDSYLYKGNGGASGICRNLFRWEDFYGVESSSKSGNPTSYNGLPRIDQGTSAFYLYRIKYASQMTTGATSGGAYAAWQDFYGGAGANNDDRLFMWAWSGHGGSGTQPRSYPGTGNHLTGFSTGASGTTTNGRQYGTEGHALHFVTIFVR